MSEKKLTNESKHTFPTIEGSSLEGKEYSFPKGGDTAYSILLVAFWRSQQSEVDTWIPFLKNLEDKHQDVKFYEIPIISTGFIWMKSIIDGGMRAGIPDKSARERTITLYTYKKSLLKDMGVKKQDHIAVYLINREGDILWNQRGAFTTEKGKELTSRVTELPKSP